jgi:hypothetical protein
MVHIQRKASLECEEEWDYCMETNTPLHVKQQAFLVRLLFLAPFLNIFYALFVSCGIIIHVVILNLESKYVDIYR